MATMNMIQALNDAHKIAMRADPDVVVFGEDAGYFGGVFRVTDGLQKDFGEARVVDTPLAESGIVGTAIGLALRGYRPVVEIQFDGFVFPAYDQIVTQLAKMHARALGKIKLPIVIRIPYGGGIGAVAAKQHDAIVRIEAAIHLLRRDLIGVDVIFKHWRVFLSANRRPLRGNTR